MRREQTLADRITSSSVWRSVVRHGYPDTQRNQALIIASNVFLHIHPVKIKRYATKVTYTFCLGGLSFFMFLVLVMTGVILMFYYVPSTDLAYDNMKDLGSSVTFGTLMRNMHRWAAQGMVIAVFLHMARVFFTGSYKPPREFNWVIGVLLLVVTFLLSFSGYLLPWDQLSLWAVTVGTNIGGAAPILGPKVNFMLVGDYQIGQPTLIRFYTLHVIFLPLAAAFLMAVHFWRIRKDGGISGPL
ncbi:MAG TPA: selenite/tellurite reduction operon b-type cytochrome ExtP [Thermomicrobiales bacterium]|nr:selenite/tellurite reduction operon b-type cytochrome ExtP [Thermomicrobiales bacterium]